MIDPLKIVVCSLKSVKWIPAAQKRLPFDEYTGESHLPGDEYTGEFWLTCDEYTGESTS